MKLLKILLLIAITLAAYAIPTYAQDHEYGDTSRLGFGGIESHKVQVTYDKTSHLIFPTAIRYVDLGSDYLIAGKAEDAENVLRVKAAIRDFTVETNFSVITDDGRFYSFNAIYSQCPATLNYDLVKTRKKTEAGYHGAALFEELGSDSPSMANLLMETIHKQDRRVTKHIGSKSYGIQFMLKGVYIHNGKFYFHTELRNRSNVPFQIDFVNFKVVDKKVGKRTVVQERELATLRTYKPLGTIDGRSVDRNVFLLDQFTIGDDKVLVVEIFERNGGRHQIFHLENADLVRARVIRDMHLQIH